MFDMLVVRPGFDSRYRSFLCLSFPIHLIYRPEKNDSVSILYLPRTVPLISKNEILKIQIIEIGSRVVSQGAAGVRLNEI